jgi:hypothetical protein
VTYVQKGVQGFVVPPPMDRRDVRGIHAQAESRKCSKSPTQDESRSPT